MQELIEFYEMASLNSAALCESEQLAILEARRALRKFVRAMESLKTGEVERVFKADAPVHWFA